MLPDNSLNWRRVVCLESGSALSMFMIAAENWVIHNRGLTQPTAAHTLLMEERAQTRRTSPADGRGLRTQIATATTVTPWPICKRNLGGYAWGFRQSFGSGNGPSRHPGHVSRQAR